MLSNTPRSSLKRCTPTALAALLILAVSVALWYFPKEYAYRRNPPPDQNHMSVDGVWDMSRFDLDSQNVFLGGEVEYIPYALLTPEEFPARKDEAVIGKVPDDMPFATARLRILLPGEDRTYMLSSTSIDYSERIYVNGEWRQDVGQPGDSRVTSIPGSAYIKLEVRSENGVIEIIRQSSNFVHKEGSGYAGIYIGTPGNMQQMIAHQEMFGTLVMGLYLCLFVVHLVLFLLFRDYRPNLWFALLCLCWLLRTGFTDYKPMWSLFPGLSWTVIYKLGCISIALTGIILLLLAKSQFKDIVQKWPSRIAIGIYTVFVPFYIAADTVLISKVKIGCEALLGITLGYIIVRIVMTLPGRLRKQELYFDHCVTLVGLLAAGFTLLHDTLYYQDIKPLFTYEIGEIGIMALMLCQMAAMFCGTMRQVAEAKQGARIAWENAELARKNETLAMLQAQNAQKDLDLHRQLVAQIPKEHLVVSGSLTMNTIAGQAFLRNDDLLLSPKEFAILLYLIRHDNQVVSREAIYESVWQQPITEKDQALTSSISRLRSKLAGSEYRIAAVRGQGYRFEKSL